MKIIALRTMFLGGQAIEKNGNPQEVSNSDGDLAIRMGWATLPEVKEKQKKAAAEPDVES